MDTKIYRFGEFLLDTQRCELVRNGQAVSVEPQVFSLLTYLIENRDRVVSKDDLIAAVWKGRIVSDAALSTRISQTRAAVGDTGAAQTIIRTIPRRGFRFVAEATEEGSATEMAQAADLASIALEQEIRYCCATDGVRIAYASCGKGPPLVKAAHWLNHLEFDWHSPVWRPMLVSLATSFSLFRYDERGNGLSDWDVEDFSLEAFLADLEAVVDAVGLEKFALFGQSHGCPVSVAYAAKHPDRVTRLVLYGGFARGARQRGRPINMEKENALTTLIKEGWGEDNPAFRQIFTSQLMPEADSQQMQWFNDLQKKTTSPHNAARLRIAIDEIDVSHLLPQIRAPTLVIHRRGDARQPFEEGRRMASLIPGAQFVALEGRNHIFLGHEPEWPRFLQTVQKFLLC